MPKDSRIAVRSESAEVLHAVLRAGHAWNDDERWALVIYVYGDISGDERSPAMAAGCYVAPEAKWQSVAAEWEAALHEAGVNHFHATDFFGCYGEFAGWTKDSDRHIALLHRLTGLLAESELAGVAYAIEIDAFRELIRPELEAFPRKFPAGRARLFCVTQAAHFVDEIMIGAKAPPSELWGGQIIFEYEQGAGYWVDFFNESKARRELWTRWYNAMTIVEKRDRSNPAFVPLQMADFMAHEGWQHAKAIVENPAAAVRESFAQLGIHRHVMFRMMRLKEAKESVEILQTVRRLFPDGRVPSAYHP